MGASGILGRACALRQAVNRSRLLETARSMDILIEVVADRDGYMDTRQVDWETYWEPHAIGLSKVGQQELAGLGQARAAYAASAFDPSMRAVIPSRRALSPIRVKRAFLQW